MNIFLIGYRATGKTTVAKLLAERLGWSSVDADDEIEQLAGKTIAEIFADEGEPTFRDLETTVIANLAQREQAVVALGGGGVMRGENREQLVGRGKIVWLVASPEAIWARIGQDTTTAARRPALTSSAGFEEITNLLQQRTPIYRACADFEIDTENKTPKQIADEVFDLVVPPQR